MSSRDVAAIRFRLLVPALACRKVIMAGKLGSWSSLVRTTRDGDIHPAASQESARSAAAGRADQRS